MTRPARATSDGNIPFTDEEMIQYEIDNTEYLNSIINNIWQTIKIERDRRLQESGYKVGTKWFHSDTFSRSQQIGLILLGVNIPNNLQWKTMDGSFATMTPTLAQQIFQAAAFSDIALFSFAEGLKATVNASEDPMSVSLTGWPLGYGEE